MSNAPPPPTQPAACRFRALHQVHEQEPDHGAEQGGRKQGHQREHRGAEIPVVVCRRVVQREDPHEHDENRGNGAGQGGESFRHAFPGRKSRAFGQMSIWGRFDRLHYGREPCPPGTIGRLPKGATHERGTGPGRHAEGRVHPDVGRQAGEAGTSAARTSRAGRSTTSKGSPVDPEPALRLADQRLVRPDDPALGRRRQDLGARSGNKFVYDGVPGTPPVVRRHASTPGSSSASGISSRR